MRESNIEKALIKKVESAGGMCEKFISPGRTGVPDRIVTLPGGKIIFVELKKPRKKPSEKQKTDHIKRRNLGCDVRIIDNLKDVEGFNL